MSTTALTEPGSFSITEGSDFVTTYEPGDDGWLKSFCSKCGGQLFTTNPDNPELIAIRMGALDEDPGIRPGLGYLLRMDTGFPNQDAQTDFSRARRGQQMARVAARLRREPDDVGAILPFDEVVDALGRRSEKRLGLQTIDLDSIVGTVDRSRREFDRSFRPTSRKVKRRWQGIAEAMRRGDSMPPIDVYRVGDLHFVIDGHHRVSVARQLGRDKIDAMVTEIGTVVGPGPRISTGDLPLKSHERLFFERVPLPAGARERIQLTRLEDYAELAEGVEAWGFRLMQAEAKLLSREEVARAWFEQEYEPVTAMIVEAGLVGAGTETEAYERIIGQRYFLLRTHAWNEEILERLRPEL